MLVWFAIGVMHVNPITRSKCVCVLSILGNTILLTLIDIADLCAVSSTGLASPNPRTGQSAVVFDFWLNDQKRLRAGREKLVVAFSSYVQLGLSFELQVLAVPAIHSANQIPSSVRPTAACLTHREFLALALFRRRPPRGCRPKTCKMHKSGNAGDLNRLPQTGRYTLVSVLGGADPSDDEGSDAHRPDSS